MAQRTWVLHPDEEIATYNGPLEVVSREALEQSLLDAAALLDHVGGIVSVLVDRQPTGFPQEMKTVRVVLEWKDRTDARAQPETPQNIPAPVVLDAEDPDHRQPPEEWEPPQEETLPGLEDESPDGFVPLAEEDLSALEPAERIG